MTDPPRPRPVPVKLRDPRPLRTCVGCRRVLPQAALLRVTRRLDGSVEPNPRRRRAGRGAYLCFREECLTETLRRGRWAQAFKKGAAVKPETIEGLRALISERAEVGLRSDSFEGPVEGGW